MPQYTIFQQYYVYKSNTAVQRVVVSFPCSLSSHLVVPVLGGGADVVGADNADKYVEQNEGVCKDIGGGETLTFLNEGATVPGLREDVVGGDAIGQETEEGEHRDIPRERGRGIGEGGGGGGGGRTAVHRL